MSDLERSEKVWQRLASWFEAQYPAFMEGLNPKAESSELKRVADVVGHEISPSLAALYAVHDGQQQLDDGLLLGWRFLPLEEALSAWAELAQLHGATTEPSAPVAWKSSWLPFALNLAGDFYCVDLEGNTRGEVVKVLHDSSERRILASSALDLFERVADELDSGTWEYSEADGFRRRR